jgi:uncharacterized membrane protein YeiB
MAAVSIAVFYIMLFAIDYETGWVWQTLMYTDFWTVEGFIRNLFYNGFHPVFPWVAFLMVGLWVGRMDLKDMIVRRSLFFFGVVLVTIGEFTSFVLTSLDPYSIDWILLVGTGPMPPGILYFLVGSGYSLIITMLCLVLADMFPESLPVRVMVPFGQMALTHYIGHVVPGMLVIGVVGLLTGSTLVVSVTAALTYAVAGIIFSYLWRKRFNRGPLELAMRKLTG